jgi:hypothetical protein
LKWVGMGVEFTHLHPSAKSSIEHLAAMRVHGSARDRRKGRPHNSLCSLPLHC